MLFKVPGHIKSLDPNSWGVVSDMISIIGETELLLV